MPESVDSRSERFARALDGGALGGGPLGGGSLGGGSLDGGAGEPQPDEELRRELAVAGLLIGVARQVGPDDAARERMRRRILAGFAEPAGTVPGGTAVPVDTVARRRRATGGVRGRLLVAAAAVLCLLLVLSGMSLLLARDALPGDMLYAVKRSAESAELGLTFGDEPRGFKHLQFATTRIDEVETLTTRVGVPGLPDSTADASRYLAALQDFDTDVAAGSRLLVGTVAAGGGANELAALQAWAEQQRQRLLGLSATMPAEADARADGSIALLDRVIERVAALQPRLGCQPVVSDARDDIGLLPAGGPCVPVNRAPGAPESARPESGQPQVTGPASPPSVVSTQPSGEQTTPLDPLNPGNLVPGGTTPGGEPTGEPGITVPLPPITVPPLPPLPPLLPGLQLG